MLKKKYNCIILCIIFINYLYLFYDMLLFITLICFIREWSGVCSPPVLHSVPVSNSLDDVSTFSNPSPRKQLSGTGMSYIKSV